MSEKNNIIIPKPSENELKRYLVKWNTLKNYVEQEKALNKLFLETYPKNTDKRDILIKTSSLNDFYSTNIFSIFPVAENIFSLEIDSRLENKDLTLVNDIAKVNINGKEKNFYSFASKYCSHHFPYIYPIYDSYVDKVLIHFRDTDEFLKFKNKDLRDYEEFFHVLCEFKEFYSINSNLKDLDKYLWLLGKDFFTKKYK